jgi:citrate synthase
MNPKVRESIRRLPQEGHPMRLFSMALQILGIYEGTGDWREDCLNVAAKIPYVAAEVIHHHAGWGDVKTPKATGYMESFAEMLAVKGVDLELLTEALRLFNILHLDHGGGNLSTFVGKATSSSLEDLYGSLSSAMCALAGPRHGRANQDCLEFVQGVLNALGEHATPEMVEEYIRKLLERGELVFGFGHAVLRVEDPRAEVFYNLAKKRYHSHPLVKIALLIRDSGKKVLAENEKISDPNPNVDAISGIVLAAAGFPYPDYFTVLFGMARVIGIGRQIVYERVEARDGKGTPIVRPKYIYKAPEPHIFGLKIDK